MGLKIIYFYIVMFEYDMLVSMDFVITHYKYNTLMPKYLDYQNGIISFKHFYDVYNQEYLSLIKHWNILYEYNKSFFN